MLEDRALELAQLRARLESELADERRPCIGICRERVGLAAGAVEGEHQPAAEPLAQRVAPRELLELPDQLGVAAEREVRVDAELERLDVRLLEPCYVIAGEALVLEVAERPTAPEVEGLPQARGRLGRPAVLERVPAGVAQPLEAVEIERAVGEDRRVAG